MPRQSKPELYIFNVITACLCQIADSESELSDLLLKIMYTMIVFIMLFEAWVARHSAYLDLGHAQKFGNRCLRRWL